MVVIILSCLTLITAREAVRRKKLLDREEKKALKPNKEVSQILIFF